MLFSPCFDSHCEVWSAMAEQVMLRSGNESLLQEVVKEEQSESRRKLRGSFVYWNSEEVNLCGQHWR